MTYRKGTVVETQTHDTSGRVVDGTIDTTAVGPGANLGTARVYASRVDGVGIRIWHRGLWDVGNATGLNGCVEGVLPCLRHRVRIRCSSRIRGSPARGAYLWKARGRGRSLTSEKGMGKVIIVVKPAIGQRAPGDMSMIVIRGDSSAMNGGEEEREEGEEDGTSERRKGQHGGESSW